jgi:DNA mismatch endonuclease, patch repair protein
MADTHSKEVRSRNMARIRAKDTKPEILVRKALFSNGFRYRLYVKTLPGKPDIVLSKYKTVIFVNGCFWHAHEGCKHFVIPKSNVSYWENKIKRNVERDIESLRELIKNGWKVIVIWECELKRKNINDTIADLILRLKTYNKSCANN